MKSLLAFALLSTCTPVFAADLLHCTVNNSTDGFFGTSDLVVDADKVTGTTQIYGRVSQLNGDVFGYFYKADDGKRTLALIYQEGRERIESLSFSLPDVVSKLGTANRYTAKEGFGSIESSVNMICDIATPI